MFEKQKMNRKKKKTGTIRMIVASPHSYMFDSSLLGEKKPAKLSHFKAHQPNYPEPRV